MAFTQLFVLNKDITFECMFKNVNIILCTGTACYLAKK